MTIPNNDAASKKINDYFASIKDSFVSQANEYKADAEDMYGYWSDDDKKNWTGYEIDSTYTFERGDDRCISFASNDYYDLLGAHPSTEILGYNFNTATGDLLKVSDITDDETSLREFVNGKILEFCQNEQKRLNETIYNEGYQEEIPNILRDNTFYFDSKGLEIICNEDTIASHAYGNFEVLIPYGELQFVKADYIK